MLSIYRRISENVKYFTMPLVEDLPSAVVTRTTSRPLGKKKRVEAVDSVSVGRLQSIPVKV